MKKTIITFSIIVICMSFLSGHAQTNSAFYYYHGNEIPITINPNCYTVYFNDTSTVFAQNIINNNVVNSRIFTNDGVTNCQMAYQIQIESNNYDSVVNALKQDISVVDVEPVIGTDYLNSVSNLIYVKMSNPNNVQSMISLAESLNLHYHGGMAASGDWYLLSVDKNSLKNSIESANLLWESGLFEDVDPGFIFNFTPNSFCVSDSLFNTQWNMAAINACDAWTLTTGSPNVKVAVIDKGVDVSHREFSNTNTIFSYDLITHSSPARLYSDGGFFYHGAHVGGIIFANHNANKIAGVAPDASLINISHSFWVDNTNAWQLGAGIDSAVHHGARVINNSLGDNAGMVNDLHSPYIENAIDRAIDSNVVLVFASGNHSVPMDYPATYRDEILTVGSVTGTLFKSMSSGYGEKLDVVAPGDGVYSTQNNNGYIYMGGTSMAAPHVSGIAALMLSVNPNLTAKQVCDIIEKTAQKVHPELYHYSDTIGHPNGLWHKKMGYGLVDAYAAVKKAKDIDLYIRDSVSDNGTIPSNVAFNWDSPDIWLEDLSGNRVENPTGNTYYNVCVRIHNRSDYPSIGDERLFLNWAKAGINDYWYENWTSYNPLICDQHTAYKGGAIDSPDGILLSSIPAHGSKIEKVLWRTPLWEDYENCTEFTEDPWHFCLLARVHDYETIAHENEQQTGVYWLVRDHNNVAQKNIYLNKSASHKSVIAISNPTSNYITRFLRLIKRNNNFEEKITDFAEISLKLDADLISSINYDLLTGAKFVNDNTLLITDDDFVLPIQLTAGQYSTLSTSVNFFTNKTPQSDTTHFDIVAYTDEDLSEIASGQGYQNIYTTGRAFHANAGNDTAILIGTNATLHATQINEDAVYRWYDKERNFKYEGLNYIVTPDETSEYILEVTAESDGYRDLDVVKVNVVPGCIRSITPNPIEDNWVTVSYEYATTVTSAQLLIYNTATTTLVGNYDLSNMDNVSSLDIEVTNYPTGSYTVVLVCDNAICHSKVLIRQ